MKMNDLALHAQAHLVNQLSPFFTEMPAPNGKLRCKHLPATILGDKGVEVIENLINRCEGAITTTYKKAFNLTLHHLAAIMGRADLLPALCPSKAASYKAKDDFTPLHFRAILSEKEPLAEDQYTKIYENLCQLQLSKEFSVPNGFGLTPVQLQRQITLKETLPISEEMMTGLFKSSENSSELHPLFKSLKVAGQCFGNFTYIDENVASRETTVDSWLHLTSDKTKTNPQLLSAYKKFIESPTELKVLPTEASGCGLFAGQDIPANSIVASFDGELNVRESDSSGYSNDPSDYYFGMATQSNFQQGIEPVYFRSVASMINDAPPNIGNAFIYNKDGLAEKLIFYSLDKINKGVQLSFCYGPEQKIKYLDYQISDKKYQDLAKLLSTSKTPFKSFFKLIMNVKRQSFDENGIPDESLFSVRSRDERNALLNFTYIINTPHVLFRLVQDRHISLGDLKTLLQKENMEHLSRMNMAAANLMSAYLIAKFRSDCSKKNLMGFFDEIMTLLFQNFSRFQKAHPRLDSLGRLQSHAFTQKCIDKLIDGLTKKSPNLEKLKKDFVHMYVESNLSEDLTRTKKLALLDKGTNILNNELVGRLQRYKIWQLKDFQ